MLENLDDEKDTLTHDTQEVDDKTRAITRERIKNIIHSIKNSNNNTDCLDDLNNLILSILDRTSDSLTNIDTFNLDEFKKFLEKNNSSIEDAAAQSSFLTTIVPEIAGGLEAIAFMMPGALIMCAIVLSAAGTVAFINYNLTTKDAEIIPINKDELKEDEKEMISKEMLDPGLLKDMKTRLVATLDTSQQDKEGLRRGIEGSNSTASLERGDSDREKCDSDRPGRF